jgi:hypothetical protein
VHIDNDHEIIILKRRAVLLNIIYYGKKIKVSDKFYNHVLEGFVESKKKYYARIEYNKRHRHIGYNTLQYTCLCERMPIEYNLVFRD